MHGKGFENYWIRHTVSLDHGLVDSLVNGLVSSTRFIVHGVFHNFLLLNHVIPALRPFKTVLDNILLEHGGLHCGLRF